MNFQSRRALRMAGDALVSSGLLLALAVAGAGWAAGPARAEDMKFERVSSDTVPDLQRRGEGRTSAVAPGASRRTPAAPVAPVAPAAPAAPAVVIGKTGDIMRVGSDIVVARGDQVRGDVLAVGGDLTIEGHVEGNAVAMGGDITLRSGARVDGDVVCMGGELHEEGGAVVGGKRVVGPGGKNLRDGARDGSRDSRSERRKSSRSGDSVGREVAFLLVWLLIGWILVQVTPTRTAAALDSFRRGPGTSFLVGWLAVVLAVPALIAVVLLVALLCITIIGIPLGLALLFGYFLFLAVFAVWGGAVGAALVGERVAIKRGTPVPTLMRSMITGVLVLGGAGVVTELLQAATFVPLFGGLGKFLWVLVCIATVLVGVAGWGALLHSEFTTGLLARWWHGRRMAPPQPPPVAPPPPADPGAGGSGTSVTTVTVPPPAPPAPPAPPVSPPAAFMPPPDGPPPATPTG